MIWGKMEDIWEKDKGNEERKREKKKYIPTF